MPADASVPPPLTPRQLVYEVYKVVDRATGKFGETWSAGVATVREWRCPEAARLEHGGHAFWDRAKYKIAKYRVVYELIEDDCDG